MKTTFKLAILFTLTLVLGAAEAACFFEHVSEGREVNRERRDLYSEWADQYGLKRRAKLTSSALIALETSMLPMARIYDLRARKYQFTGLFCDDFIPISETPNYSDINTQIPRLPYIHKLSFLEDFEARVRKEIKKENWAQVRELTLIALDHFPAAETHCLTRHFVESLGRIAALAPRHIRRARENGIESPSKLIASMIKFHLFGLGFAEKIDSLAAPLQYKGIPIVCQDVPFIPIPALAG